MTRKEYEKKKAQYRPSEINKNRIVRVRNEELHKAITHIANYSKMDYQFVFEWVMDYLIAGHVWGDETVRVIRTEIQEWQAMKENGHG